MVHPTVRARCARRSCVRPRRRRQQGTASRTSGELLVEGATKGWSGLTGGERAALAAQSSDPRVALDRLGFRSIDATEDARSSLARLAAPCLTINSLSCDDGEEHRTVIPHVATARCDARLAPGQRVDRVPAAIRKRVARIAPEVEFHVKGGAMEPSRTSPDLPYAATIAEGAALGLGQEPRVVPAMRGSLPLYVFTELLGAPCYGLPLANPDAANHASNENLELARHETGIVAAAGVLLALGKHGGT